MSLSRQELRIIPLPLKGEIRVGDSVAERLIETIHQSRIEITAGDILVIKHKILSKAEGRFIELSGIRPSGSSKKWAKKYKLDPRVVELVLAQSKRIVRRKNGVLITETSHGFVCANNGIDVSNVDGGKHALLLPEDSDRSAKQIHRAFMKRLKLHIPVIVTDTFGRPWREGLTEVAIGIAGMKAVRDLRGEHDPHGYRLRVSLEAVADELACAAGLVCGKLERVPACIVRGFHYQPGRGSSHDLIRPAATDLFR